MAEPITESTIEEMVLRLLFVAHERSINFVNMMEYFKYTVIALVIACYLGMVLIIVVVRPFEDDLVQNGSRLDLSLQRRKDVTAFSNPFITRLVSTTSVKLSDGIWVEIACLKPCEVHVYWGTSIQHLHSTLLRLGRDLIEDIHNEQLFTDQCLAVDSHNIESAGKHCLHFPKPQSFNAEDLGPAPRQRYPCVVIVSVPDTGWIDSYTDVVALVTLVHLEDNICTLKTHIIDQYVKMAEDAVFRLQPLFLASFSDEECSASDRQPSDEQSACSGGEAGETCQSASLASREDSLTDSLPVPDCIICRSRALNCVLLPCRHACVCSLCFPKLQGCPLCRSPICSYFLMKEERCNVVPSDADDQPKQESTFSRLGRLNHRLNEFFGFE